MRFEILDVEHGFAAYAQGSDGRVVLFDCGYSSTCRPSDYLPARGIQTVSRLVITNYDEDHIGDLPELYRKLSIEILTGNTSLSAPQLRSLKQPPISPAMELLLQMMDSYTRRVTVRELEPPGLRIRIFHNDYPAFADTNNLSLLTFLDVGRITFVLPGDLERDGWLALLQKPDVRAELGRANVLIASHHGRESGYCREVFDYCKPSLIVISDGAIQYDSQKMASKYANHASGEMFNGAAGNEFRKVVSTRRDGVIYWES